ncbi:hypothetical protein KQ51_00595 [Candidatus Izimaplasma bacterium HR1]|jgi:hypothetical protein|uniref:DUF2971 domain-containing protein n=1 Tax=Candidatus Izimoplasma sp. HR1 TaxID=1541959 RepID=UPI0004F8FB41|nr:hypothetical protein KQ51_00595 [Candidatus Izimaplasma bacterium HR1]
MNIEEIKKSIRASWQRVIKNGGKLYQYRSCKDYNFDNLKEGLISLNRISSFNDLWEGRFEYFTEEVISQSKYSKFLTKESVEEIIKLNFNANRENIYASCLSESKNSELMWAHYGDTYKGYIVEYDYTDTYQLIQSQSAAIFPIIYEDVVIDFSQLFVKLIDVYFENLLQDVDHVNAEVRAVIASNTLLPQEAEYVNIFKKPDWSYEKEWRIMTTHPDDDERIPITVKASAVYMGSRISEVDKKRLMQIASRNRIDVYQMSTDIRGMNFTKIL